MKQSEQIIIARLREMNKENVKPVCPFEFAGDILGLGIYFAILIVAPLIIVIAAAKYILS